MDLHLEIEACSSKSPSSVAHQVETSSTRSRKRKAVLIDNPRQLAAHFACCVTTESTTSTHWVAKNGESSLFKTLQRMLPEVSSIQMFDIKSDLSISQSWIRFMVSTLSHSSMQCTHLNLFTDQSTRGRAAPPEGQDLWRRVQQACSVRVRLRQLKNTQAKCRKV